jgi:hypothetical protein
VDTPVAESSARARDPASASGSAARCRAQAARLTDIMLGALNVEDGHAARLDHVPDRQHDAQEKDRLWASEESSHASRPRPSGDNDFTLFPAVLPRGRH